MAEVEPRPSSAAISETVLLAAIRALRQNRLVNRIQVLEDGAEAIESFHGREKCADRDAIHVPRVVLLDLKLPEADGLEVNSYIVKPVEFGKFTEAIREIGLYWVLLRILLNEPPR